MAKAASVFHSVNGYSRYDTPESKAFSCTPGPLYPVRIQFINARDRVKIAQGIDVRSNPLAVPTFNPYIVRLHRFWVPLQLYHPEMRTNSSKFDMNDLSTNWIATYTKSKGLHTKAAYSNSLFFWLRAANRDIPNDDVTTYNTIALPSTAGTQSWLWANADTYLAYWDIVRNYYGYSQWGIYSIAWPASWMLLPGDGYIFKFNKKSSFFYQNYCNLEYLDAYYESQFYPGSVASSNNTYNRGNLFSQILDSQLNTTSAPAGDGYPVSTVYPTDTSISEAPASQFAYQGGTATATVLEVFNTAHPLAVVPSNPDRFSRLIPFGSDSAVSMTGVTTIPQLAIASRLQEYKDLLGAGGSRYSDWLETFFASKIEHVDRPKLLFSASQTVNVQVVMNQSGGNNFAPGSTPLGQQGGAIAFNSQLGRAQSYYFREPGYMIDMLSIRPVYYWAGVRPDYLNYQGSDYFNPIYNDIGYQDVASWTLGPSPNDLSLAQEPCFNEFRSSYDEVLGQLSSFAGNTAVDQTGILPLYSYWVQQRSIDPDAGYDTGQYYDSLFVDMSTVNSPFKSNIEDNFFVNLSYSIRVKNLVNKSFATRLSNR